MFAIPHLNKASGRPFNLLLDKSTWVRVFWNWTEVAMSSSKVGGNSESFCLAFSNLLMRTKVLGWPSDGRCWCLSLSLLSFFKPNNLRPFSFPSFPSFSFLGLEESYNTAAGVVGGTSEKSGGGSPSPVSANKARLSYPSFCCSE